MPATTTAVAEPQKAATEDIKKAARETANKLLVNTRDDDRTKERKNGEIILEGMFAGDPKAYEGRNTGRARLKAVLEEIESRKTEQRWSMTKLSRCVRLHLQWLAFGDFNAWPDLEVSHFYEVQVVDRYPEQKKLLDQAQKAQLSARELREAVRKSGWLPRKADGPKQPPTLQEIDRVAERLQKSVTLYESRLEELTNDDARLTPICRNELAASAKAFLSAIAVVREQLASW